MRPCMLNKQEYQYIMAHIRLFVLIKGITEYFSAMLVFLKPKNLNIVSA
jgi:hypothetical protein